MAKEAAEFIGEVNADPDKGGGPFFDPKWPPVTIMAALTKDLKSLGRWHQLAQALPEDWLRQELYTAYCELRQGERPRNPGAALNARLGKEYERICRAKDGEAENK